MNNPFGSSSGGGFGASRSMQQGFGSQQQQAPQQQSFGIQPQQAPQQQGFGGFGGQQQGFGGFGGFGGQQMQNPFQQAPQQQGFGGYGGQQQGFGGYGGFGGQQQGFGGFGGQQQYNPYQQMQQMQQMQQYNPYQQMQQYNPYQQMPQQQQYNPYQQQQYNPYQQQQYNPYQQMQQPQRGGFDPRAISANPAGFQQWTEGARQQETQRPGSTMMSKRPSYADYSQVQREPIESDRMQQPMLSAPEDMMSPAVMPQDYGQQQQSFGDLGGAMRGFGGLGEMMRRSGNQFQPGLRAQPAMMSNQQAQQPSYDQYVASRNPLQQDVQLTRDQYENPVQTQRSPASYG